MANIVETVKGWADNLRGLYAGAATNVYRSTNYGLLDVVSDYKWTLSKNFSKNNPSSFDEVPYIILTEYEVDQSTIVNQISYYATASYNAASRNTEMLSPYENLFPRKVTGNAYKFPYFSEVNFEINTPIWKSLDTLEAGKSAVEGIVSFFGGEKAGQAAGAVINAAAAGGTAALAATYPRVGVMDRPRLWESHDMRSINVKFPLFNTVGPDDWKKNRALCWILINANLYTKRDFITSIPPVYYEIEIPGQHYSYASCVTKLTINNRGNMRMLKDENGRDSLVPDAYEIDMTLTDMVMPSRNLFQSIGNPKVISQNAQQINNAAATSAQQSANQ